MLSANEQYLYEQLLAEERYQTYAELSVLLNLSERTIRTLLQKLEPHLLENGLLIEKKYGSGIKLVVDDTRAQATGVKKFGVSSQYRREVIQLILLFNYKRSTSINLLCQQLYVTKSSIISALEYIEETLKIYGLSLEKNWQGTRVIGKRKHIKSAIVDTVHKYGTSIIFDNHEYLLKNSALSDLFMSENFREIISRGISLIEKDGYVFNYDYFQTLLVHLIIDIHLFGKKLEASKTVEISLATSRGKQFQHYLETTLGFRFKDSYNQQRLDEYFEAFNALGEVKVTKVIRNISKQIIDTYAKIRRGSFVNRALLEQAICDDLGKFFLRKNYRISVFHPFLDHLINQHNAAFVALRLCLNFLVKTLGKISDDELSFILVTLLNEQFVYEGHFHVLLQSRYSDVNNRYLAHTLEKAVPDIAVRFTDTALVEYDFVIESNEKLNFMQQDSAIQMDALNTSHIMMFHEVITKRQQQAVLAQADAIFETTHVQAPMLKKMTKEFVLRSILDTLAQQHLLSDAELETVILEQMKQQIFWSGRKIAFIVVTTVVPFNKDKLFIFKLAKTIKWKENNEMSRINTVYVLLANNEKQLNIETIFNLGKYRLH